MLLSQEQTSSVGSQIHPSLRYYCQSCEHQEYQCCLDMNTNTLTTYYNEFSKTFDDVLLAELLFCQNTLFVWTAKHFDDNFQTEITNQSRHNLAKWLLLVGDNHNLRNGEVHLALTLTDYALGVYFLSNNAELYLIGCTCLVITARLMNNNSLMQLSNLAEFVCFAMMIEHFELESLIHSITDKMLTYEVTNIVIPFYFMDLLINRLHMCPKHHRSISYRDDTAFILSAQKFINQAAMFPGFNVYKPAIVAAACIISAVIESGYTECLIDSTIKVLCETIQEPEDLVMACHHKLSNVVDFICNTDAESNTSTIISTVDNDEQSIELLLIPLQSPQQPTSLENPSNQPTTPN